jgi:hypothetical protein
MPDLVLDIQLVVTGPTPDQLAAAFGPEIPTATSQPLTVEPGPPDSTISWASTYTTGVYRIGIVAHTDLDHTSDADAYLTFQQLHASTVGRLLTLLPNIRIDELTVSIMTLE